MQALKLTVRTYQTGRTFLPEDNLLLVAVDTPKTAIREQARQLIRQALREILAPLLACPPEAVALITNPGQAPQVANRPEIGVSISHEPELSLLAINFAGPLGVDLMHLPHNPEWSSEIDVLARDYLGRTISGTTPEARQRNFAEAWTQHEAIMKCMGCGLEEFNPALQERIAGYQTCKLNVKPGFIASLARLKA